MRKRHLFHIATGGTVGSGLKENGVRDVDEKAQQRTLELLQRVPFTTYESIPVRMRGDSSAHPRALLVETGCELLKIAHQGDGGVIEYGTDTMNLTAATLALMGNEVYRFPFVLVGSMQGPDKPDSDAPENLFTGGFFAAYGNGSGIFAVRPGGIIITSRHDIPGGLTGWHERGYDQKRNIPGRPFWDPFGKGTSPAPRGGRLDSTVIDDKPSDAGYFARVDLEQLLDEKGEVVFDLIQRKRRPLIQELHHLIAYERLHGDESLDSADQTVVGGRGRLPPLVPLGYGRKRLITFKERPKGDTVENVVHDLERLLEDRRLKGKLVQRIIPSLALIEHIMRHREKPGPKQDFDMLYTKWKGVMSAVLTKMNVPGYVTNGILKFWERYSNTQNTDLDFQGIDPRHVATDPQLIYRQYQHVPPRAVILQATGAAGMRLRPDFGESYEDVLALCRKEEIPVVLVASSRGEVTSFEYGPGYEALVKDLVFFAGTMDRDLVEPRLALMNHPQNQGFLRELVKTVEGSETLRFEIRRNMYRQLLSGSHYRGQFEDLSDRSRVEMLYGIESRIDLLGGVHVKKAILGAYLHEVMRRGIPVGDITPVLEKS